MRKHLLKLAGIAATLLLFTVPALPQARSSAADLTGVISDPTRVRLKGATITIASLSTGLTRSATSDATGAYRIPLLPPGQYEVKVEMNGYNTQIRKGVLLTVGQTVVINFEMAVGFTKEIEVIQTDAPVGEPERTHQAQAIGQKPINNLPINGRNFLAFVKLTPGVTDENPAVAGAQPGPLTTSGLSFAGQNARTNSVQIDGVDNNDITSNGVRPTIGQEAVSEFQINRNSYNPEFGRATGGVINIVSKSGTNEFHGNFFNYLRSESIDSRNTFATGLQQKPKFRRNQPGFTLGGPIRDDKTFFFAAYEGLFRRESAISTILADSSILQPSTTQQAIISTLLRSNNPNNIQLAQKLQGLLTTAPNSPVPGAGQFFPQNRATYNYLANSTGAFPVEQNASTASFRLDHAFTERDYLFFRYSLTNDSQHNAGIGGQFAPSSGFDIGSQDHSFTFGETHVFRRSGASNEFRLQLTRNIYNINTVDPFGPRVQIAGIGFFGREFASPSDRTQRRLQFLDNLSLTRGRHNFKFGGDFSHYNVDTFSAVFLGGTVDFAQLPIPLAAVLDPMDPTFTAQLRASLNALGRSDLAASINDPNQPLTTIQQVNFGLTRSINQGFGNPRATLPGNILGFYWQDSVKVKSNLQLSFGMRYDYDLLPPGTPRDKNNISPRFSFAYDPFKTGRTVIRGGGGIYYQQFFVGSAFISSILGTGQISNILVSANAAATPVGPNSTCGTAQIPSACFYRELVSRGLLTLPSTGTIPESAYADLLGLTRQTSNNRIVIRLDPNAVNPYAIQSSLGIDQQLGRDWNLSLNYLINRGMKLIRPRQVNAIADPTQLDAFGRPALIGRIDQTRSADFVTETAGTSVYHGLAVSMNKRLSRHYQVIGSYTFSKAIDDATDNNFEFTPQDPTNARADRARSAFDVRHVLSVAAIVDSPFRGGAGRSLYERVLSDMYLSPIVTMRSGFPFNVLTGIDVNMDNNPNDRPFGLGRNAGFGPGYFSTDVRLGRRFHLGSDNPRTLEVSLDTFNLFNRVNYRGLNNNTGGVLFLDQLTNSDLGLKGSPDLPASSFRGFTTAYDPRILQLGLKLNF
ncbi:MAG TPA: carboxypeptidase regulatory-like domain-containing protein [Blastocatellia bacterium]|nr:carboxypeptidase regulatory-like domain-containing protein [Blastocatellia bacterium]